LARYVRSNMIPALEDMALWHERDISHSSVERIILPDNSIALDYMLNLFTEIMEGLVVYPENMQRNMKLSKGLYFSSKVLAKLQEKGVDRDKAYDMVQRCAMKAWEEKDLDFKTALLQDPEVRKYLSEEEINKIFNVEEFIKYRDVIFERVFGKEALKKT